MTMPRPPFRSAARLWSLWARPRPEIGAAPLPAPRLPAVLPRWDDICVAVLWLAQQRSELGWRQMDGNPEPPRQVGFAFRLLNAPPPPPPNIAGGIGTGPALASEAVLALLGAGSPKRKRCSGGASRAPGGCR